MKKAIYSFFGGVVIFLLIIVIIITVVDENKKEEQQIKIDYDQRIDLERKEKERRIEDMNKRTVELSFMGFKLGASFSESIQQAKSNKDIYIQETSIEKTDGSITFATKLCDIDIECKICSFQDTITSLIILTKNHQSQTVFKKLYTEKYGDSLPETDLKWIFENGGIEILTHTYSKSRIERIPGREKLSPTNLQNYREVIDTYFEMLSITYNDFKQIRKVKIYEDFERNKSDSLKNINSKKQREIKNEENRKALDTI